MNTPRTARTAGAGHPPARNTGWGLPQAGRGRALKRLASVAVSAAMVAVLAVAARDGAVPDVRSVRPAAALLLLVLVFLTNNVVCGVRWSLLLPGQGLRWAVRRYTEAAFWGLVLPFAGDVYRSLGGRERVDAVVFDRLLSGLVILAAAGVSAATLALPTGALLGALAVVAGALAAWARLRPRVLRDAPLPPARVLGGSLALTALYIACVALTVLTAGHAVGFAMPAATAILVAPMVLAGAAAPSLLGLSPGLAVLGWSYLHAGATAEQAATAVGLFAVSSLVLVALGGLSLLAARLRPGMAVREAPAEVAA